MRLILHAGTHKTGTTSIQKVLAENCVWLRERGLFYPDGGAVYSNSATPHHRLAKDLTAAGPKRQPKAMAFIDAIRRDLLHGEAVLISAEAFHRHIDGIEEWEGLGPPDFWQRRRRYLERLAEVFADFNVEIVIYFRDRDEYADGLFNTLLKKGHWLHGRAAFDNIVARHLADYDRQLQTYRAVFSKIIVRRYEDAVARGLLADFFETIGFPMPPGADSVWERRRTDEPYQISLRWNANKRI